MTFDPNTVSPIPVDEEEQNTSILPFGSVISTPPKVIPVDSTIAPKFDPSTAIPEPIQEQPHLDVGPLRFQGPLYAKAQGRAQNIVNAWEPGAGISPVYPIVETTRQVPGFFGDVIGQLFTDVGHVVKKASPSPVREAGKEMGKGLGWLVEQIVKSPGGQMIGATAKPIIKNTREGLGEFGKIFGYKDPKQFEGSLLDYSMGVGGLGVSAGKNALTKKGIGVVAKQAAEQIPVLAVGTTKKSLGEIVGDIAAQFMAGRRSTPAEKAMNEAAKRTGFTMTRSQELAPAGAIEAPGLLGLVEKMSQNIPGGSGVMASQKRKTAEEAIKAVENIAGNAPGSIAPPSLAQDIATGVKGRLEKLDTGFREMYGTIVKAGNTEAISGEHVARVAKFKINQQYPMFEQIGMMAGKLLPKEIPSGVSSVVARDIDAITKQIENLGVARTPDKYSLFRNVKMNVGEKAYDYTLGHNDREAYKILYNTMKDSERAHIARVAGEDGVKQLDDINRFFSATKDIRDMTGKLVGYNKDIAETGFVDAEVALDRLLSPKNAAKASAVMKLMDNELKENLRIAMLAKIFDKALMKTTGDVSVSKIVTTMQQYNRNALKNLIGADTVKRIDDFVTGMRRIRSDKFNIITDTNASGTARNLWSIFIPVLAGGGVGEYAAGALSKTAHAGTGAMLGAAALASTAMYTSNVLARFLTKKGFTPERIAAGSGLGGYVGYNSGTTPEEKTSNMLLGVIGGGVLGKKLPELITGISKAGIRNIQPPPSGTSLISSPVIPPIAPKEAPAMGSPFGALGNERGSVGGLGEDRIARATEIYLEKVDSAHGKTLDDLSAGKNKQQWYAINPERLQKIWREYSKTGIVRDERGLDEIADDVINKIATIESNTVLAGHTASSPNEIASQFGIKWSDDIDNKISDYIADGGSWRISDYALNDMQQVAIDILAAKTAEDKLLAVDRLLNIAHQRSDLAAWFIKGGRSALDNLSQDKNISGSVGLTPGSGVDILTRMAGGSAVGGVTGSQVGDTPEERARNTLIGAGAGMVGAQAVRPGLFKALAKPKTLLDAVEGLGERGAVGAIGDAEKEFEQLKVSLDGFRKQIKTPGISPAIRHDLQGGIESIQKRMAELQENYVKSPVQSQTHTPQFKQWFGGSKVVDEQGNPLVVYHGTTTDRMSTSFKNNPAQVGVHFGTSGQANDRLEYVSRGSKTKRDGTRVYPVFLNIKNPLRLSDIGDWRADNVYYELSALPEFKGEVNRSQSIAELRKIIKKHGYDGIVYKNEGETQGGAIYQKMQEDAWNGFVSAHPEFKGNAVSVELQNTPEYRAYNDAYKKYENYRKENGEDSYITFSPTQIKSATGNAGEFSRSNPSISAQIPLTIGAGGLGLAELIDQMNQKQ